MIEFKDVSFTYDSGNKNAGIYNINLNIKEGEIFGILGTNGAGKTTTLRIISTLLKPTSGTVEVNGLDTVKNGEKVREKIGFLTSEIKLDPNFTPDYLFDFFGELRNVPKATIKERKEKLFSYFGIDDFKHKKIEELSTGMKQKAAIAVSLMHNPEIIIFDEPTSGLDIITAKSVLDYIKELKSENKTIIMSTHNMTEAEKVCDRIGIIIDGKLVFHGTIDEVVEKTDAKDLEEAFFKLYSNEKGED